VLDERRACVGLWHKGCLKKWENICGVTIPHRDTHQHPPPPSMPLRYIQRACKHYSVPHSTRYIIGVATVDTILVDHGKPQATRWCVDALSEYHSGTWVLT
jgi:hypothetical protein